ncbi:hypothetical protein PR202_ga02721 [Eleusine coracana subsp. coracana]|uniref:RWP-RK domain-containing protein n=1 Tax=Eleusine coracana subsp. coracana TaxID=191504 RepID=A0AAV5BKU0_ELECO|nr:hypothetical protein PR202_ga02721 [Eleusine coracana subsp. coracana]
MESSYSKDKEEDSEKALIRPKSDKTKKGRDMRRSSEALTFELVSRHFCMPINQAAKELNVGVTSLKLRCRELGIPRWPHRKVKILQTLIDDVQELEKDTEPVDGHRTRRVVEMLQQTKKLIEERPAMMLDKKTRQLRQACLREKSRRKKLMGHGAGDSSMEIGDEIRNDSAACRD